MIEEDCAGRAGNRAFEIGIFEDDVRRLASELQRHFLQIACGGVDDQLANLRGTGEGDFVHIRMRGQRAAGGFAVTRNDVDDALREACFRNQFSQTKRRKRRLLCRLQHDGAAGRERGTKFPGSHQEREIPRDDLPNDADRFPQCVCQILRTRSVGHR